METTQKELNKIKKNLKKVNRIRKRKRKQAKVSTEKGTMGTIRKNNLQPRNVNIEKIKKENWENFVKKLEEQTTKEYYKKKDELYKQNYLKGLRNMLGTDGEDIINRIEKTSAKKVVSMYYKYPALDIYFLYSLEDVESKIEEIDGILDLEKI